MVCVNSEEFNNISEAEQNYIKTQLRRYNEKARIPSEFFSEYQKLLKRSNLAWREAKEKQDYSIFKPFLNEVVENTKRYYSYIREDENINLYDVMLNKYEMAMTSKEIDKLFDELKTFLIPLIASVSNDGSKNYNAIYTDDELIECAKYLLDYIGFDLNKGCLGIFPHGFMTKLNANDIRIAFRNNSNPLDFAVTVIHEGGHGIFEQSINKSLSKYENTEIDNLYALHESQSRFYENMLGRNINFWIPIYDKVKDMLKLDLSIEEFVKALNTVKVGPTRIGSDELTYCLHIIIRYEIERDLINGTISVDDLPRIWNKKTKEYLGVEISNDSEGLMQDIHWSEGHFGYFPSYLLGAIYDGMFLEQIEKEFGSIDELLKQGRVKEITKYLIKNIYQYGGAYNSHEVFERVCQKKLSIEPIKRYFEKKFK